MKKLRLFVPLTKVDAVQRIVYGVATAEEVDKSGEIFDYATSAPLFRNWSDTISKVTGGKSLGNVRAMHGKVSAGVLKQIEFNDDDKQIEVAAKITDDNEWNKVQEGNYTGFSIGGKYEKVWKGDDGVQRFTANPSEISIVDNPCVTSATFSMIKADGIVEDVKFHLQEIPEVPEAEKSATPSNEAVAARATVLAKIFGEEPEWPDYIEQARGELTKAAPKEEVAAKAAVVIVDDEQPTFTNEEVALEATKMAKEAGHEAKWPDYIVVARDNMTKAFNDKKKKQGGNAGADATGKTKNEDGKGTKDTHEAGKDKTPPGYVKADFVPTLQNPEPGLEQVWKANDGKTFAKKAEAQAHNATLNKAAPTGAAALLAASMAKADAALALKPGDVIAPTGVVLDADGVAKAFTALEGVTLLPSLRNVLIKRAGELKIALPDRLNVEKADAYFADLRKSLYDVGRLAELIQSLQYFQQGVKYEEEYEQDVTSTTAADTQKAIADLCMILRARVVEETQEIFAGEENPVIVEMFELAHRPRGMDAIAKMLAEDATLEKSAKLPALGLLAKVGAKHSMKDQSTLNKAHDALGELGADCSGGKDTEKLAKAGARHSKADLGKIQQAHGLLVDVGAECSEEMDDEEEEDELQCATPVDLTKLDETTPLGKALKKALDDNEALTKVATEAVGKIDALTKRVEEIAAQPMPGGPRATETYRVVGKGEDDAMAADANTVLTEISKSNPEALATALIKLSQSGGGKKFQPGER